MCVCVCVCVCVHACVCMCVCVFVCVCVCVYICVFLQDAWHGASKALQVYGDGQNVLPTIHVHDLAR